MKFVILGKNSYIGEEEILKDLKYRLYRCTVRSASAEIWVFEKEKFIRLLKSSSIPFENIKE